MSLTISEALRQLRELEEDLGDMVVVFMLNPLPRKGIMNVMGYPETQLSSYVSIVPEKVQFIFALDFINKEGKDYYKTENGNWYKVGKNQETSE